MSGFVYLWRDRKHHRFYIGCHWGKENDGYICSSAWMLRAFIRRPSDFKRRIISRIETSRIDLLNEEYRWLCMIKDSELKIRYYNLNKRYQGHWSAHPDARTVREKIRDARKKQKISHSDETRKKLSISHKNRVISDETRSISSERMKAYNSKRIISAETSKKISLANTGRKQPPRTEEYKKKISEANSNPSAEAREKMRAAKIGKKLSEDHKKKIIEKLIGRPVSEETRQKQREAALRRIERLGAVIIRAPS